jgi:hypothetical protein
MITKFDFQNQASDFEKAVLKRCKNPDPEGQALGYPFKGVSLPCPLRKQGKLSPCF